VSKLILATNENDILARFFRTGIYGLGAVHATLSPSMDIQVASNFERYLYYRVGEAPAQVRSLMERFAAQGQLEVPADPVGGVDPLFAAGAGNRAATLATIKAYGEQYGYLLDPHTAVGVAVGQQNLAEREPMLCLATAHPAKFGDAVQEATGKDIAHHPALDRLLQAKTRCVELPGSVQAIKSFIEEQVRL
jgi:threonine synthase